MYYTIQIDDHQHYLGNSNSSATMKGTWHVPTPGSLPPSKGPAPPTLPLGDKYEENDEGYVNKMTVVQQLAKDDPLFDSYLKMTLRDRPAGRVSQCWFLFCFCFCCFFQLYFTCFLFLNTLIFMTLLSLIPLISSLLLIFFLFPHFPSLFSPLFPIYTTSFYSFSV